MEAILNWGVTLILAFQGLGESLVGVMKGFTFLGNEEFYLFIAPALYWCVDTRLGLRIGLTLLSTGWVNDLFKLAFHGPRPYWYDPTVKAFSSESSFGVPSGHSQSAVVVWGGLAAGLKRSWMWIIAVIIILGIGLSRMYLGVHFPHDVLLGWLIGALLIWGILAYEKRLLAWFNPKSATDKIVLLIAFSLVWIMAGALIKLAYSTWVMPPEWTQNALKAAPDADPIAPWALSGLVSNAGAFVGLVLGAIWISARGGFSTKGPAWQLIARFLVGLVGVILLWFGLGEIFPRGEYLLAYALRYLRYFLVGLWMAGLGPAFFIRVGLAK